MDKPLNKQFSCRLYATSCHSCDVARMWDIHNSCSFKFGGKFLAVRHHGRLALVHNSFITKHKTSCATPSYWAINQVNIYKIVQQIQQKQGVYLLSGKTSYHERLWSLEAARLDVVIIVSLWNLTGISAALLSICLSNFTAIGKGLNINLAVSKLHDILRWDVPQLSE